MKNSKLHLIYSKYYVVDVHIDSAGEGAYVSASAQPIEVNVIINDDDNLFINGKGVLP